jgi:predicted RNase H-like nuclease (RuvC/YqgF family)
MTKKETIESLESKINRREKIIIVLNDRIKELQKRLDSDVIIDIRFIDEINDEKEEIITLKKEIKELEKETKQLKRSLIITESNKY